MVRTLFKNRFWWLLHDKEEIEKVQLIWTQVRKNSIMETIKCLKKGDNNEEEFKTPLGNKNRKIKNK